MWGMPTPGLLHADRSRSPTDQQGPPTGEWRLKAALRQWNGSIADGSHHAPGKLWQTAAASPVHGAAQQRVTPASLGGPAIVNPLPVLPIQAPGAACWVISKPVARGCRLPGPTGASALPPGSMSSRLSTRSGPGLGRAKSGFCVSLAQDSAMHAASQGPEAALPIRPGAPTGAAAGVSRGSLRSSLDNSAAADSPAEDPSPTLGWAQLFSSLLADRRRNQQQPIGPWGSPLLHRWPLGFAPRLRPAPMDRSRVSASSRADGVAPSSCGRAGRAGRRCGAVVERSPGARSASGCLSWRQAIPSGNHSRRQCRPRGVRQLWSSSQVAVRRMARRVAQLSCQARSRQRWPQPRPASISCSTNLVCTSPF
jgi:hypothetical protein